MSCLLALSYPRTWNLPTEIFILKYCIKLFNIKSKIEFNLHLHNPLSLVSYRGHKTSVKVHERKHAHACTECHYHVFPGICPNAENEPSDVLYFISF